MKDTTAYFDASNPDTIAGLNATVAFVDINGIPSSGTGLAGAAYVPGTSIWSIEKAREAAAGDADATFVSSELAYGSNSSETTVAEFIGDDASTVQGNGDLEMGPSALSFTGYIYIPPGAHEISVYSDDGFDLNIGGVDFSEFADGRAPDSTARVVEFDGGLYELDLLYFDGGGGHALTLEIDGLPVDQSAFYQSAEDFTSPPGDVPVIPVDEYHPSFFLGEDSLDVSINGTGTQDRDEINGKGADDMIEGLGGDDELMGGFGDDTLLGGDGDDVLDGGYGSDLLEGGDGNDILISRSDAGEQRIGQLAIDQATRDDPDGEVDEILQKLSAYADEPLVGDDILIGGDGNDVFLISPQIDAKLDIIEQHVKSDGTINWAGVAGENDELHDHWVDSYGIDIIADYVAADDTIAVIGHTAVPYVTYADFNNDGIEESIITTISVQHGGGGAHDRDLLGQTIVFGDRVEVEDIQTDDNVTYGVVENYADVVEALAPIGDTKTTDVDGEEVKGYDTRTPQEGADKNSNDGTGTENLGAVTGDPYGAFENTSWDEGMIGAPSTEESFVETRTPFEQLGFEETAGETITGDNGGNDLSQADVAEPDGLPGALGFWSMGNGVDGAYDDLRGEGGDIKAFTLFENQALLNTEASTDGPDGSDGALYFNGEDSFAFLEHDPAMTVTQGTIAMWVRPDDLGEKSMFVTKDHTGSEEGSHFRLGHTDDGGLFLRFADPYKTNHAWETDALLTEGEWAHLAVNFTEDGITVYVNGEAVPDGDWTAVEGGDATPGAQGEAMLLQNEEPWVFGADQHRTELNDTAQEFALDNEDLRNEFEGAIADFGVWGGFSADDALTAAEINDLIDNGPGSALTNPSGVEAMLAADDLIEGLGGNDTIDGEAGDDTLDGGDGNDSIQGGYGDDHLIGGNNNDTLDGGRGNDYLEGGDGDDVLISRSDAGEQRAGQLVLNDPSRPDDNSIDYEYLKLADWIDQEIEADDVLVGGAGADKFQFETLINGKKDIIAEHTNDDRTIDWMGVAGENTYIHDHWVDGIGVDVIADFDKSEGDTISIKGHTTQVEVDYHTIDTDGDGVDDDAISLITLYSQQGGGGGAHDEDYLGYVVVHGDKVEEDDIETDAGVAYGIVETIDDIQEAVAPTGDAKWIDLDGDGDAEHLGYDSRDVDGDPIGTSPWDYSSNEWLNSGVVDLASSLPEDIEPATVLLTHNGGSFGGGNDPVEIPHDELQAAGEGTWSFTFNANNPGNGNNQALFSKDHSGLETGGHLTAYITSNGQLKVRYQSDNSEDGDVYLTGPKIDANEDYHLAFTFDDDEIGLYLNGELVDADTGFEGGMSGNEEDLVLGASTRTRVDENDNLQWHFDGEVENLLLLDRPLEEIEILFLAEGEGDIEALNGLYAAETEEEEQEEEEQEEEEQEEEEQEEEEQEEEEQEEEEQEEEEAGLAAILSRIFDIFLSIFGMGGNGNGNSNAAFNREEVEEELDEIETLLTDLIPQTGDEAETIPSDNEEEDEVISVMMM